MAAVGVHGVTPAAVALRVHLVGVPAAGQGGVGALAGQARVGGEQVVVDGDALLAVHGQRVGGVDVVADVPGGQGDRSGLVVAAVFGVHGDGDAFGVGADQFAFHPVEHPGRPAGRLRQPPIPLELPS